MEPGVHHSHVQHAWAMQGQGSGQGRGAGGRSQGRGGMQETVCTGDAGAADQLRGGGGTHTIERQIGLLPLGTESGMVREAERNRTINAPATSADHGRNERHMTDRPPFFCAATAPLPAESLARLKLHDLLPQPATPLQGRPRHSPAPGPPG